MYYCSYIYLGTTPHLLTLLRRPPDASGRFFWFFQQFISKMKTVLIYHHSQNYFALNCKLSVLFCCSCILLCISRLLILTTSTISRIG